MDRSPDVTPPPARPRALPRALLALTALALCAVVLLGGRPAAGDGGGDDGVPSGTVAFFAGDPGGCPTGWVPADVTGGRIVVGATAGEDVAHTVGTPLGDLEDRTHVHAFHGNVSVPARNVAAADGSNNSGAQAGTYAIAGDTMPAKSGLPFVQLVACEKP
jgi:hypothetical protein